MTDEFMSAAADTHAPLPSVDQHTAHRAARAVAGLARDTADAWLLLTMLGLLRAGRIVPPPGVPAGLEPRNPKRITRLPGRWR